MRSSLAAAGGLLVAGAALAHITPNVELVRKGDFLRQNLPGATRFFERHLMLAGPDGAAIRKATGWSPAEEDLKVYVGRDDFGREVGSVVFLWIPSLHGPVGVGVAFDPRGAIRRAAVTDVGGEPLAWVRPLLDAGGMRAFTGLGREDRADPARVAPGVTGSMSRYYAGVVAEAVGRAQAIERVVLETAAPESGSGK